MLSSHRQLGYLWLCCGSGSVPFRLGIDPQSVYQAIVIIEEPNDFNSFKYGRVAPAGGAESSNCLLAPHVRVVRHQDSKIQKGAHRRVEIRLPIIFHRYLR